MWKRLYRVNERNFSRRRVAEASEEDEFLYGLMGSLNISVHCEESMIYEDGFIYGHLSA